LVGALGFEVLVILGLGGRLEFGGGAGDVYPLLDWSFGVFDI